MKIYIILKYLFLIPGLLRKFKISENEWSSLGEEANGGSGGGGNVSTNTNNNEVVTNNLHLLAASAGLSEDAAGAGDNSNQSAGNGTANTGNTPVKRRRRSSDADGGNQGPIKMQTDVVRVPGLSSDLQQQITKFDSSEFDVSTRFLLKFEFLNGTSF